MTDDKGDAWVEPEGAEEASAEASSEAEQAADSVEEVIEEISELAAVTGERDQFRDALQHLQADFENYRKRMTKQQGESIERANENLVKLMLPVLDTIELAQAHEPNGSVEQVSVALLEVLNKAGLERMDAVSADFDPEQHEAVAHEEGEGGAKVSEEFRAGYRWKGRVLRPAMVKVVG